LREGNKEDWNSSTRQPTPGIKIKPRAPQNMKWSTNHCIMTSVSTLSWNGV